ncbi:type IIL restriction-modification enzyme MmeI [Deinococcus frigens]|uniref:type IIL restriction-modification enzyme MmeI n=1 Tax=Deinococcus frigens TaxID=249403 RepID=UPI000497BCB1|nr:type IIL restriction-modification enzyme MmeI [Deinococcus frigens]
MAYAPANSPEAFIAHWSRSGGNERANDASFLNDLCGLLGVPRPDVSTADEGGAYVFERRVSEVFTDGTSTPRSLDLYRQGYLMLPGWVTPG